MTQPHLRRWYGTGITLLVLNDANITRQFQYQGSVFRWARSVANEVEAMAVVNVIDDDQGYQTGQLIASIHSSVVPVGTRSVNANVRAETRYALWYHNGHPPHVIKPRGFGYPLRFFWRRVGRWVEFDQVHHPGWRGNPFLTDAKDWVLRRRGIRHI